jgi:hypothetical protein
MFRLASTTASTSTGSPGPPGLAAAVGQQLVEAVGLPVDPDGSAKLDQGRRGPNQLLPLGAGLRQGGLFLFQFPPAIRKGVSLGD